MKTIIAGIGIVAVMYGAVLFIPNGMEVIKIEKEEIVKEVTPDWASDEEAVKAAQAVIRRKELETELNALESNFEALTASYEAEKASYKAKKTELEKELGTY